MRKVFITGVSSGFGKQALHLMLERGHRVIAGVRGGKQRLIELASANLSDKRLLTHLESGQLLAVDLHMQDTKTFQALTTIIEKDFSGQLDVLINNAGFGFVAPLEAMNEKDLRYQMDVNFTGPACLIQSCLPYLKKKGGRIINVSSIMGIITFPFYSAYCASKYALEGFSEALHYELKPFGVDVCLIEPGAFKTDFLNTAVKQNQSLQSHPDYQLRMSQFNNFLQAQAHHQGDPAVVAHLLCNYVDSPTVPLRRPVGVDGYAMAIVNRIIPKWIYASAVNLFFKLAVFRGRPSVAAEHL